MSEKHCTHVSWWPNTWHRVLDALSYHCEKLNWRIHVQTFMLSAFFVPLNTNVGIDMLIVPTLSQLSIAGAHCVSLEAKPLRLHDLCYFMPQQVVLATTFAERVYKLSASRTLYLPNLVFESVCLSTWSLCLWLYAGVSLGFNSAFSQFYEDRQIVEAYLAKGEPPTLLTLPFVDPTQKCGIYYSESTWHPGFVTFLVPNRIMALSCVTFHRINACFLHQALYCESLWETQWRHLGLSGVGPMMLPRLRRGARFSIPPTVRLNV